MVAEDKLKMNKYEIALCEQLSDIMAKEDVNFSVFLPVLVDEVPPKSDKEYYKVLKKEQMKLRRGSLSIEEVNNMLNIIGWQFKLALNGKEIKLKKLSLYEKVRFTDLTRICELLGINITWGKTCDRAVLKHA